MASDKKARYSGIVYGRIEHGEGFREEQHIINGEVRTVKVPDIRVYNHGDTFETDDEAVWNALHRQGAVKLPHEDAPTAAAQAAAQAAELEAAQARIAELEALVRSQTENKAPKQKLPE